MYKYKSNDFLKLGDTEGNQCLGAANIDAKLSQEFVPDLAFIAFGTNDSPLVADNPNSLKSFSGISSNNFNHTIDYMSDFFPWLP